jgi:hypothetical protein
MKRLCVSLAALVLIVASAGRAVAGPVLEFSSLGFDSTNGAWSLGYQFTTNTNITVTALGMFDDTSIGGPGWTSSHDVGIYDSVGNLLVSKTVLSTDPLVGHFRYSSVGATVLASGATYYVVGETGVDNYGAFATGLTVDPSINYVQDAFVRSSTLAFPTGSEGITSGQGGGIWGASFEASPVPEPASLTLLCIAGAGLFGYGWKRRKMVC